MTFITSALSAPSASSTSAALQAASVPKLMPCGIEFQSHLLNVNSTSQATPVSSTAAPAGSGIWTRLCSLFQRAYSCIKSALAGAFSVNRASADITYGDNAPVFHNARSVELMAPVKIEYPRKPEIPAGLLDNGYAMPDNWQQRNAPGTRDRKTQLMDELEIGIASVKEEIEKRLPERDLRNLALRAAKLEGASSGFIQTRHPAAADQAAEPARVDSAPRKKSTH